MLYAAKALVRVSLTTRLKCLLGKPAILFPKKAVSFFYVLFRRSCFPIENFVFVIWAKSTFPFRTFGPFFIVLKPAQYL